VLTIAWKALPWSPIAFNFGAIIAVCTGIVGIRSDVLLIMNVVPPLVAVLLGSFCAALKIERFVTPISWGVFVGAVIFWMPITLANYFFPIIFIPIFGIYAAVVPSSAYVTSKMLAHPEKS
jgi:hypothetical protein